MTHRETKLLVRETTRKLRHNQTEAEGLLWQELRNRKLFGKKFLRQHPLIFSWRGEKRFFVADFYCHEAQLIVELDGSVHVKQRKYDNARDTALEAMGVRVVRFDNDQIENNLEQSLKKIEAFLNSPLRLSSGQAPSPLLQREESCEILRFESPSLLKRGGNRRRRWG